jgi:hypothetical protein
MTHSTRIFVIIFISILFISVVLFMMGINGCLTRTPMTEKQKQEKMTRKSNSDYMAWHKKELKTQAEAFENRMDAPIYEFMNPYRLKQNPTNKDIEEITEYMPGLNRILIATRISYNELQDKYDKLKREIRQLGK